MIAPEPSDDCGALLLDFVMRVIAACVEADIESIAFNGEPGVIKTTTIRSALNGGSDEH